MRRSVWTNEFNQLLGKAFDSYRHRDSHPGLIRLAMIDACESFLRAVRGILGDVAPIEAERMLATLDKRSGVREFSRELEKKWETLYREQKIIDGSILNYLLRRYVTFRGRIVHEAHVPRVEVVEEFIQALVQFAREVGVRAQPCPSRLVPRYQSESDESNVFKISKATYGEYAPVRVELAPWRSSLGFEMLVGTKMCPRDLPDRMEAGAEDRQLRVWVTCLQGVRVSNVWPRAVARMEALEAEYIAELVQWWDGAGPMVTKRVRWRRTAPFEARNESGPGNASRVFVALGDRRTQRRGSRRAGESSRRSVFVIEWRERWHPKGLFLLMAGGHLWDMFQWRDVLRRMAASFEGRRVRENDCGWVE